MDPSAKKVSRITHVAIRYRGKVHSLPPPYRHPDIVRRLGGLAGPDVHGFLDDQGNFLTRREALRVALACGQVLSPASIMGDLLYSEDLW